MTMRLRNRTFCVITSAPRDCRRVEISAGVASVSSSAVRNEVWSRSKRTLGAPRGVITRGLPGGPYYRAYHYRSATRHCTFRRRRSRPLGLTVVLSPDKTITRYQRVRGFGTKRFEYNWNWKHFKFSITIRPWCFFFLNFLFLLISDYCEGKSEYRRFRIDSHIPSGIPVLSSTANMHIVGGQLTDFNQIVLHIIFNC